MQLKDDSVSLYGLHPKMQIANALASLVWIKVGQELVITSALDGKHGKNSLHPKGRACDYRTRYFDDGAKRDVARELQEVLGDDYDVVLELDHIHCEYDPSNPKEI